MTTHRSLMTAAALVLLASACNNTQEVVRPDSPRTTPQEASPAVTYTLQWVFSDEMYLSDDDVYGSSVSLRIKGGELDQEVATGVSNLGCRAIAPDGDGVVAAVRCFFAGAGAEVKAVHEGERLLIRTTAIEETVEPVMGVAATLPVAPGARFEELPPVAYNHEPDGEDQDTHVAAIGFGEGLLLLVDNPGTDADLLELLGLGKPVTCAWRVQGEGLDARATVTYPRDAALGEVGSLCAALLPKAPIRPPVGVGAHLQGEASPFTGSGVAWPRGGAIKVTLKVTAGRAQWTTISGNLQLPGRVVAVSALREALQERGWALEVTPGGAEPMAAYNGVWAGTWRLSGKGGGPIDVAAQVGSVPLSRCGCALEGLRVRCEACGGNVRVDLLGDEGRERSDAMDAAGRARLLEAHKALSEALN